MVKVKDTAERFQAKQHISLTAAEDRAESTPALKPQIDSPVISGWK